MRRLILLLCSLLPIAASACTPAEIGGTGTRSVIELNTTGGAAAWWCPGPFKPSLALYAVRWDALTDPLRADLAALPAAADHLVAIERMRAAHVTMPLASDALRPVWLPARDRIAAARPHDPVWIVARNGTYATRPAYALIAEHTLSTTTARATVGASCGCRRLHYIDRSTTYCGIDGESQLVAVCTRQPD